jgi:predicted nucleic acid-binding protein
MAQSDARYTLLDACAVVNLYATRRMSKIIAAMDGPVAVVDIVAREAQFVWRGGNGDDAREREPVDLQLFFDDGLLSVISSDDEDELLTFIDLTAVIGEGEAMTAAVAIHRGCTVVTDDRKASRELTARGVSLRTSLDLAQAWHESAGIPESVLRSALADLRQRGTYEPARAHPPSGWWDRIMAAK